MAITGVVTEIALHNHRIQLNNQVAYRLINSKYPPIDIFDDVADATEFEALFAIQQLTNPRLQNQMGNLNLLPTEQIPFGIAGCSYAYAPFTHINPDGSRFSDGSFGVLYLADKIDTAISEVLYHQHKTWRNISELHYDNIVMRGLKFIFSTDLIDLSSDADEAIHHTDDYTVARIVGNKCNKHYYRQESKEAGIQYNSVRKPGATCWALMSPKSITSVVQASHYEFIYDAQALSDNPLSNKHNVRLISAIS